MVGILAIETSTEACSVAVSVGTASRLRFEHAPRQHNQLVFAMLRDLLPDGNLNAHGIDLVAYASGPGSFTGLRIAASAAQGLAYSNSLPVVPVSTLSVLAQGALREGRVAAEDRVLCSIDAHIGEIYSAVYVFVDGLASLDQGPWVCAPSALSVKGDQPLKLIESGGPFYSEFPAVLKTRIVSRADELLPVAADVLPLAHARYAMGEIQSPLDVQPVYVRDEISWKKLPDQGKRK